MRGVGEPMGVEEGRWRGAWGGAWLPQQGPGMGGRGAGALPIVLLHPAESERQLPAPPAATLPLLPQRRLPLLAAHLEAHGVVPVLFASQWFLTVFSCPFPVRWVPQPATTCGALCRHVACVRCMHTPFIACGCWLLAQATATSWAESTRLSRRGPPPHLASHICCRSFSCRLVDMMLLENSDAPLQRVAMAVMAECEGELMLQEVGGATPGVPGRGWAEVGRSKGNPGSVGLVVLGSSTVWEEQQHMTCQSRSDSSGKPSVGPVSPPHHHHHGDHLHRCVPLPPHPPHPPTPHPPPPGL